MPAPAAAPLPLLLSRDDVVVVDKPPGLSSIPGRLGGPSAAGLLEVQLGRRIWVVHRLDRDTSGVLLFALTAPAHRAWSMAFERGEVHKRYLALVEGRLTGPVQIDAPLAAARRGRARVAEGGKPALTRVVPVRVFENATLVEAVPATGRTHQIRVHLAHVGHPLLVDRQYRRPAAVAGLTRTPLHASRLSWADVSVESRLPADLQEALAQLGRPTG